MTSLSSDEIIRLSQDLVYQVAYAFYDPPYILLIKLLIQLGVSTEKSMADLLSISSNELRRYMGTLHVHRLVKRYVNKERSVAPIWSSGRPMKGETDAQGLRVRDVHYWYLDYREFANVVKYRLAMMRRGIDEKIKQDVGYRGYICPHCTRTYDPLDIAHLFDPISNVFACESCATELVEHDPTTDPSLAGSQDRMGRFNLATAPIRDALKAVEGVTLPSLNIIAWIALNVKVVSVDGAVKAEEDKKFKVILGGEGDEREKLEKERLAEAQRTQNALPVWHTHSTVTGSATTLGLPINGHAKNGIKSEGGGRTSKSVKEEEDELLAEHYETLLGDVKPEMVVKREPGIEEDDGEVEEMEDVGVEEVPKTNTTGETEAGDRMILVGGVSKAVDEVTDEDQEMMTTDEYQAYYEAMADA